MYCRIISEKNKISGRNDIIIQIDWIRTARGNKKTTRNYKIAWIKLSRNESEVGLIKMRIIRAANVKSKRSVQEKH